MLEGGGGYSQQGVPGAGVELDDMVPCFFSEMAPFTRNVATAASLSKIWNLIWNIWFYTSTPMPMYLMENKYFPIIILVLPNFN